MIKRTNAMGDAVAPPNGGSIINVNYGHDGGGRLYSYEDDKGTHRTGDEVVVEVTSKKGKTYKTLAKVRSTHGAGTAGKKATEDYLAKGGKAATKAHNGAQNGIPISLKKVLGGSQSQLPGYGQYAEERAPVQAWREDSAMKKQQAVSSRLGVPSMQRLNPMGEVRKK